MQTAWRCGLVVLERLRSQFVRSAPHLIKPARSSDQNALHLIQKAFKLKNRPTLGLGEFVASGSILKFAVLSNISY